MSEGTQSLACPVHDSKSLHTMHGGCNCNLAYGHHQETLFTALFNHNLLGLCPERPS